MACDHCHGRFVALDPSGVPSTAAESDLLRRAEALLRSLEAQQSQDRRTPSAS
jgi:hypothetical protein